MRNALRRNTGENREKGHRKEDLNRIFRKRKREGKRTVDQSQNESEMKGNTQGNRQRKDHSTGRKNS
jgi:hypothetical protein